MRQAQDGGKLRAFRREISGHQPLSAGIGGKVWKVQLADGSFAALKQADPAISLDDVNRAADYLRWRDGLGCARLYEQEGVWSLIEWAGEQSLANHAAPFDDVSAAEIAAETLIRLHKPTAGAAPGTMLPLPEHFSSLFRKAEADRKAGIASPFTQAATLACKLLGRQRDNVPLHGDIHHENLMLGERGCVAIDPKGLVGDPLYDAANLFFNPVGYEDRHMDARALRLAGTLAVALKCGIEPLLQWAIAYGGLSAAWHLEDGNSKGASDSLATYNALNAALAQAGA